MAGESYTPFEIARRSIRFSMKNTDAWRAIESTTDRNLLEEWSRDCSTGLRSARRRLPLFWILNRLLWTSTAVLALGLFVCLLKGSFEEFGGLGMAVSFCLFWFLSWAVFSHPSVEVFFCGLETAERQLKDRMHSLSDIAEMIRFHAELLGDDGNDQMKL